MSQPLEELADVYGQGPPIRPFRISVQKRNGSGYGTISRTEIAPENAFAIWDQCFVIHPCSGGLLRNERARNYILRVACLCKDADRLFIGDSVIRGSLKRIAFEGDALEERITLLKQFLVRAFGYNGRFEVKYYREADPEIYLGNMYLGRLSEIIRKFQ